MSDIVEQLKSFQSDENIEQRNEFIKDYLPFVLKSVSKTTGYYVHTEDSDEFCIGLEAFDEAIDRYQPSKGNFIGFADMVIRSRVTDYMRKEWKYNKEVNYDDQVLLKVQTKVDEDLLLEIQSFKDRLLYFGITLDELTEMGPKHKVTRLEVTELSKNIAEDEPISHKLYRTKKLPMAEIVLRFSTTKKRLKSYRSYIIGVVVVFKEQLEVIKTFINLRGE